METGFARILVQNTFCIGCIDLIKTKMMEVQHVSNVTLYPSDSLVVFNFAKANQISEVLNTLTSLGYPPKGDRVYKNKTKSRLCACAAASVKVQDLAN
jgi:hypothetical protein